jgi:hypothetical protein
VDFAIIKKLVMENGTTCSDLLEKTINRFNKDLDRHVLLQEADITRIPISALDIDALYNLKLRKT